MAAAEAKHNLPVHFSTTLPIGVDKSGGHAVQGGEASSAQAIQTTVEEQSGTGWSIAAPGFARADLG
jgi:hypothetical protein